MHPPIWLIVLAGILGYLSGNILMGFAIGVGLAIVWLAING